MQPKSVRLARFESVVAFIGIALASGVAEAQSNGVEIGVVGPLERVDCRRGTAQVLGITAQIKSNRDLETLCSPPQVNSLVLVATSGALIHSEKSVQAEGALLLAAQYVPGATTIFVRGPVTSLSSHGEFSIVGVRIQSPFGEIPRLGQIVDVVGTQPLPGGVVLAQDMSISAGMGRYEAMIHAISASDENMQSIIGSGRSAQSIIGSGAASQSLIGTGVSTSSIIGSGRSTESIIGTGAATSSIIGSGRSTESIIGSGASISSIIGSGRSTQSAIGSGAWTSSIIGSGASAQSIIGSGRSTQSIIGSGVSTSSIIGSGVTH